MKSIERNPHWQDDLDGGYIRPHAEMGHEICERIGEEIAIFKHAQKAQID